MKLQLLPPHSLIKTGTVDHADWNFRPILGWIQRLRFRLVLSLLPKEPINKLLEVGYGSGIFLPELSQHCYQLYGTDIHHHHQSITQLLEHLNIHTHLYASSVEFLPFADQIFDTIVAVSTLEFVEDIEAACLELKRVLKPGKSLIIITPGHSPLVDWGLKLLTGESAKTDYEDRRQTLIPILLKHFTLQDKKTFPRWGSSIFCLYKALKLSY
ncbi:class I SAM-dependent methyltransferase [Spirulina subsalsa FACHB-351]|uniref:Class I SAM-dependent methyltransferase n=1 Tax=Spirulina subsalsa FACHB-351 TaxID=234711 RepID=A0ABT3L359_9CYAN|nr:class I SAM-dependent methyltransferase [Spirulina subsalsa]MCW6035947.1 class I SAM-dependent methyltransferase [Spirulina subsalsa FACHB-351]